jgi:uncharacterized membrane protein YedE/YeeE
MEIVNDPAAWRAAVIGGALIGLAAALLLWLNGRVAGISGTLGGAVLGAPQGDRAWRFLFLGGLIGGALLVRFFSPTGLPVELQAGWGPLLLAGVLVGVGTRMGNGCTSGHGLCGIARFSQRSILATITFMLVAMITVYVVRHVGA